MNLQCFNIKWCQNEKIPNPVGSRSCDFCAGSFCQSGKKREVRFSADILWTTEVKDEFSKSVLKDEWRDEVLKSVNWDYPGLEKAKKLYLQLGFLPVEEKSRWYQIL